MSERFDTLGAPDPRPAAERDLWEVPSETEDDDHADLDPAEAAALLERTREATARRLDLQPPFLTLTAAVVVLVAYGAIWLSVRHQHPYSGPTGSALGVLYGVIAAWAVVNAVVLGRRTSGVGGRAARERRVAGLAFAFIWIMVYVFQGALYHAGVSHEIVYGIWPAAAPVFVVGSAAAAYQAARERWSQAGLALAAVAVAAGAAYTGPVSVWAVVGIGLSVLLGAGGSVQLWLRSHQG